MILDHLSIPRLAAVAAAALTPFAVPAAASAAGTASVSSGVLTVNAASGDTNWISIGLGNFTGGFWTYTALDYSIRPALENNITAGTGCTSIYTKWAECSSSGFSSVVVNAGDKNDRLSSDRSNVTFNAGAGDDWMVPSAGANVTQDYNGDGGTDTVNYNGGPYAISASLDGTRNDGYLGNGNIGSDVERIIGGYGNDTMTGSSSVFTTLMGQSGDDSITAGSAGGHLYGGKGDDTLTGGSGNDEFTDWLGEDTMIGGSGDDTFHADDTEYDDSISCGAGYDVAFVDGPSEISDWGTDGESTSCEQVIMD